MQNKRKAMTIARMALAKPNPRQKQTHVEKRVADIVAIDRMAMEFAGSNVDISSLSDKEWLELLKARGMTDDQAFEALENLAAYGVVDSGKE